MKHSMGRSWPGNDGSNDPRSIGSENQSSDSGDGVELSSRSLGNPKPNVQSASPAMSNAAGHKRGGRKRDMVGYFHSFSQLHNLFKLTFCSRIEAPRRRLRQPLIE
jgi:hypothetical protein